MESWELIYKLIRILIKAGGDINKMDNTFRTPFISALNANNFKILDIFLECENLELTNLSQNLGGIYHELSKHLNCAEGI